MNQAEFHNINPQNCGSPPTWSKVSTVLTSPKLTF